MNKIKYLLIIPIMLLVSLIGVYTIKKTNLFAEENTLLLCYAFPQNEEIGELFNVEYQVEPKVISKSSDDKYYVQLVSMNITVPQLTFDGWYWDSSFTNKVNKDDTFTIDGTTLYGKFIIDTKKDIISNFKLYKDKDSNLFINDITNLYKTVVDIDYTSIKVAEDNYTGKGSTLGVATVKYELTYNSIKYYETVSINIINGLNANYIFNNTIYINSSYEYSKADLVSDLKLIGDLSSTSNLSINIYSDYYDVEEKQLEYDDVNVIYSSADGTQGNLNYNLKLLSAANYDLIEDADNDMLASILLIIFVILVIFILYSVFNGSKKSYRYRRRR